MQNSTELKSVSEGAVCKCKSCVPIRFGILRVRLFVKTNLENLPSNREFQRVET